MLLFCKFAHFACVENIDSFVGVFDGLLILLHHGVDRAQVLISSSNIILNLTNILLLNALGVISEDASFDV